MLAQQFPLLNAFHAAMVGVEAVRCTVWQERSVASLCTQPYPGHLVDRVSYMKAVYAKYASPVSNHVEETNQALGMVKPPGMAAQDWLRAMAKAARL